MNVITIAGTVGKHAEMKYLNDRTAIAAFSVADSQGKDKTVWWNCSSNLPSENSGQTQSTCVPVG